MGPGVGTGGNRRQAFRRSVGLGVRLVGWGGTAGRLGITVTPHHLAVPVQAHHRKAIGRLASAQRGLISAAQAAELGVPAYELARAVKAGYLRRARSGVYVVQGTPASRWEPILAAALASRGGAVISHSSAAAVQGLYCPSAGGPALAVPELTVTGSRLALPGTRLHVRRLRTDDTEEMYGARITTPARTLVDLAGRLPGKILERSIDEALLARKVRLADLERSWSHLPSNFPGRARVQQLLSLRARRPLAESHLEARVYDALQVLPPFRAHYVVSGPGQTFVLDAAWPDRKVGVEIDGWRPRTVARSVFDRERRKLNALGSLGWRIVHLTAAMAPEEMLDAIRGYLAPDQNALSYF